MKPALAWFSIASVGGMLATTAASAAAAEAQPVRQASPPATSPLAPAIPVAPPETGGADAPGPNVTALLLLATGEPADRRALQPLVDVLCRRFHADAGGYTTIVQLAPDRGIASILQQLAPRDVRTDKGALLRQIHGGLKDGAFVSCLDGPTIVPPPGGPLEIVIFTVADDRDPQTLSVSVSRYLLRDETITEIGQTFNALGRLFQLAPEVARLGACIARSFWKRSWISDKDCQGIEPVIGDRTLTPPPPMPPTHPSGDPPSPVAPPRSAWWRKGWVWAVGSAVAGAVVFGAIATSRTGAGYPACPEMVRCPR